MSRSRLSLFFVALLVLPACAAKTKLAPDVVQAGQLDLRLPPGWKVTRSGATAPAQPNAAGSDLAAQATTTIPLAKQNPTTAFFQATSSFSSCLKGLGVAFIGAPDPKNPGSPANNPNYLKSLETCAARSHIVQALSAFQTSQNNLTPKQIQQQNQQYLQWRTCMIGRGWTIPEPTPDSKGRLFSFSGGGSGGPQLKPPAGEDPFNSPDIQACATQSQAGGPSGPS
jgi:hypothetical protein